MADYYQLISRAVACLDPDAPGESRRNLYERAHAALLAQLRIIKPPFTEAEITREQLALEEAIRRVEGEAAQRVPTFSDLVTAADDPGQTTAEANEISVEVPTMLVTGAATGRLTRIWRWRSISRRA